MRQFQVVARRARAWLLLGVVSVSLAACGGGGPSAGSPGVWDTANWDSAAWGP